MQKLTTTEVARGLIAKLGRDGAIAAVKKMRQTAEAEAQRTGGLFAPMIRATQMRPVAKADLPTPPKKPPQTASHPAAVDGARIAERQSRYVDPNDPAATHNEQLRQTREQHDDLLAAIRAVHAAGPGLHPTGAPK